MRVVAWVLSIFNSISSDIDIHSTMTDTESFFIRCVIQAELLQSLKIKKKKEKKEEDKTQQQILGNESAILEEDEETIQLSAVGNASHNGSLSNAFMNARDCKKKVETKN